MPQEVGAAAAYEAYRQIKYGSSMYQFLYGDYDRHREALRALAIAEGMMPIGPITLSFASHVIDFDIHSCTLVAGHGPRIRPIWHAGRM